MYQQNVSYLVEHSDLGTKNLNEILPDNCLKNTKMATTVSKFSKIFRGSMSPDQLRTFFILKMLQNNLTEKTTLDNISKFGALFLKKFLITP